jgi:hypothetical protein
MLAMHLYPFHKLTELLKVTTHNSLKQYINICHNKFTISRNELSFSTQHEPKDTALSADMNDVFQQQDNFSLHTFKASSWFAIQRNQYDGVAIIYTCIPQNISVPLIKMNQLKTWTDRRESIPTPRIRNFGLVQKNYTRKGPHNNWTTNGKMERSRTKLSQFKWINKI